MSSAMAGRLLGSMTPRDRRALGVVAGFLFAIAAYTQLIEPSTPQPGMHRRSGCCRAGSSGWPSLSAK
jgi:type II secretory pathway component PulM